MKNRLRKFFCDSKKEICSLFAEHGLLGGVFLGLIFIVIVVITTPVAVPIILVRCFNDWTKKFFTKDGANK